VALSRKALQVLRGWLDEDPVVNAHVINRAFFQPAESEILTDDPSDPRAVVVLQREQGRIALAAREPSKLVGALERLPPGEYHISSVDLELVPVMESVMEVKVENPVWLFRMERKDFRPHTVCETRPIPVEHARMIAEHWWPEGDASPYVRSRIEEGLSAGIFVDGDLVAWDLTHFETDRVVMLGFLHVKEAFRGRGYAKTVTTAMCEKVFDEGKIPACQVYTDNEAALKLTEAIGFRRVKRQAWGTGIKS
jgi:ribosomal protein S18 acetylase RimI-like enzyme